MEKIIKYQRICELLKREKIQDFFDGLVTDGWEIIYYDEQPNKNLDIIITVIVSKRQSNIL